MADTTDSKVSCERSLLCSIINPSKEHMENFLKNCEIIYEGDFVAMNCAWNDNKRKILCFGRCAPTVKTYFKGESEERGSAYELEIICLGGSPSRSCSSPKQREGTGGEFGICNNLAG